MYGETMQDNLYKVQFEDVQPTESSFIRGITYLPDEDIIEILLKGDDGSSINPYYYNGGEGLFTSFVNADSYGSYYTKYIKQGHEVATDTFTVSETNRDMMEKRNKQIRKTCSQLKRTDDNLKWSKSVIYFLKKRTHVKSDIFCREDPGAIIYHTNISVKMLERLIRDVKLHTGADQNETIETLSELKEKVKSVQVPLKIAG